MSTLSRRSLVAGAAGTAAAGLGTAAVLPKRSSAYAVPNVISQTGSNVEITFWYGLGGNIGERIQDVVAEFNAQNTGVVVTGVQQANYDETGQLLTISLQDGTYPDLALMSEIWWFRFYLANALIPMDDLIASTGYDIDDVVDSLRVEGYRAGQHWWLPVARSTPLMYYNTAMYEAAGLPGPATTYSQMFEYAQALTNADQQVFGLGFPATGSYSWQTQGQVWAYGGTYSTPDFQVTLNQPAMVQSAQAWQDALSAGSVYISQDAVNDFTSGYLATAFFSTGSLVNVTTLSESTGIEFGTAFLPGELDGVDKTCPTGGSGLGIMANTSPERQAAAFAFLSYWSSPERTAWWSRNTGYMPIRKSAVASPEMQQLFVENPRYKVAVDQLAARTQPQDVARRLVPTGEKIIGDALNAIMVGPSPVQETLDAANAALQAECDGVASQIVALEGDLTSGAATPTLGTPGATPAATPGV